MFRGKTARPWWALLAAVLLVLPFFTIASPFAHAHTARQTQANATAGLVPQGKALRNEYVTSRDCDRSGGPAGPLHTRDRNRVTMSADSAPQEPDRALLAFVPAATHGLTKPAADRRPSRSSAVHSPSALQVFRC